MKPYESESQSHSCLGNSTLLAIFMRKFAFHTLAIIADDKKSSKSSCQLGGWHTESQEQKVSLTRSNQASAAVMPNHTQGDEVHLTQR